MQKNILKFVFILFLLLNYSCDDGYATVGSEVIGDNHFDMSLNTEATIVAYTEKTNAVQSNGFPVNPFGIYNNPNFGITKAHFVSQVQLSSVNPTFENIESIVIDSVKLYIPYFSTITEVNEEGARTYELDSIYGGDSKFDLKIFENGYFMRNFDPNTENFDAQKYYTSDFALFDNAKIGMPLNDDPNTAQNSEFFFNPAEIIETEIDEDDEEADPIVTRVAPGISFKLNTDFFQEKLFNPSHSSALLNNNNFVDHFRGLFFKVEQISGQNGSLMMLDFADGVIEVFYKEEVLVNHDNDPETEEVLEFVSKSLELTLTGNRASLIEQTFTPAYNQALENPNTEQGDALLWVKGNEGSLAVVKLFGRNDDDADNGFTEELQELRTNDRLVNEANLTFVIDQDAMVGSDEPVRVLLYDIPNKRTLVDYTFDQTTNGGQPKLSKLIHGGIIERELSSGGRGVRYKIRITNHIRNIIRNDSTNVRLGLVVTEDIASANLLAATLKNASQNNVESVPAAAVMNPLGTVLYGTDPSVPDEDRLKLNIYFTKPN